MKMPETKQNQKQHNMETCEDNDKKCYEAKFNYILHTQTRQNSIIIF